MITENSINGGSVAPSMGRPEIDWKAQMETLCARSPTVRLLRRDLRKIQSRLGGPDERPDDKARAADIAHSLNNMLCAVVGA